MLEGLEWIGGGDGGDGGIGMDARWEEGIGRNSHMLELQELGGFKVGLGLFRFRPKTINLKNVLAEDLAGCGVCHLARSGERLNKKDTGRPYSRQ